MKKQNFFFFAIIILVVNISTTSCKRVNNKPVVSSTVMLSKNWKMQPVDKLEGISDEAISQNDFNTQEWFEAIVPGTVLGSMATTGVIEEPYFGINMQKVEYDQFKQEWWFRTSFNLMENDLKKNVALRFNGINYRADLWINGKKVASKNEFAGTFRMFTFNINNYIKEGENVVALKMLQHADGEYSIGFFELKSVF